MTDAFCSSSEAVLQRVPEATAERSVPLESLEEVYQISKTCQFISSNQYKKVALQFPDELLVDSVAIADQIEKGTQAKVYILGDTSYGSCCVDEVAAEHAGADCMVHYGRACLSPSRRLPLMYVFERRPVDLERCAACFRELYPDAQSHVVVLYDVNYAHVIDDLLALLTPDYPNVVASTLLVDREQSGVDRDEAESDGQVVCQFGRRFALKSGTSIKDYGMFFVGVEGATLRNFMMTWSGCTFRSFDPTTSVTDGAVSSGVGRALMKRYYAVERAKDHWRSPENWLKPQYPFKGWSESAKGPHLFPGPHNAQDAGVVGILVGTLGVADYLSIIQQLKAAIRRAGKKSYVFAMGKINVAKLANFLEIDVYVLIACPENSLLDSSEFYRPVVTPYEMELACNKHREWSEDYVTDFRHLLPGGLSHVPLTGEEEEDGDDDTDVSLITGALRTRHLIMEGPPPRPSDASVVLRNPTLTVANTNTAASFLAGRSWQGLEQKLGETPVVKAVEGRRGIAIAYEEEGTS